MLCDLFPVCSPRQGRTGKTGPRLLFSFHIPLSLFLSSSIIFDFSNFNETIDPVPTVSIMGVTQRLELLFAQDSAILQIDTHLRPAHPAGPPAEPANADQTIHSLSESPGNRSHKLSVSVEEANSTTPVLDAAHSLHDTASNPHNGTFCPITAISRFPYHHIRGDLMQRVASKFFDKGQFWDRPWDL